MLNRRTFLSRTVLRAPPSWRGPRWSRRAGSLGANERIRLGLIGAGSRGEEIFRVALRCPNVEGAAVADVLHAPPGGREALVPGIKAYRDFRRVLDDPGIDAVLIATRSTSTP